MVAQIPPSPENLPDPLNQTSQEFESAAVETAAWLKPFAEAANQIAVDVNEMALNAEVAVAAIPNAKWVAGTYAQGAVVWSPTDFLDYRCKVAGARNTDPALDSTNWAPRVKSNSGESDTTSSAVDVTLTSSSGRLQIISMTASGKKVTLPSASTLQKGVPVFVIKNSGAYRFAVRKNGGVFLCYVNPGEVIAFGCSDISTSAGVWTVSGASVGNIFDGNTPETLNSVDSRNIAVAMMSATKAICAYRNNSSTFLEAVILNFGSASGTPLQVSSEASRNISIAAQSATQATVIYQPNANTNVKGYVLDVSGSTITPGSAQTIHTGAASTGYDGTGLCVLTTSKLLCLYAAAGATSAKERVLDISGTTITASSEVTADTGSITASYISVHTISATKALTAALNLSEQIALRLQSISGSTPAPTGSVLTVTSPGTPPVSMYGLAVLDANRAIIIRSLDRAYGDIIAHLIDISGTSPVLIGSKNIKVDLSVASTHVSVAKLDSRHVYISWTGGYSGGVDAMVLGITSDDRMYINPVLDNVIAGNTSAYGYLSCDALDSTHVMQVSRTSFGYLTAKTIEIS